jgi:hypothetical protein
MDPAIQPPAGFAAGVLALVRGLALPKIAVFGIGKAVSLASGIALMMPHPHSPGCDSGHCLPDYVR